MRRSAVLVFTIALLATSLIWGTGAGAATMTITFTDGVLTLTGVAGDDVMMIGCDSGKVTLNSDPLPGSQVGCGAVVELRVLGKGGSDEIDTGNVTKSDFDKLKPPILSGGGGYDTLDAGEIRSTLNGGGGNDILFGGEGLDTFNGGTGSDEAAISTVSGLIKATPTSVNHDGQAEPIGGIEALALFGSSGDDTFNATRFAGPVTVLANAGNDTIRCGSAADDIRGGSGNDSVFAGRGADTITGDMGDDTVDGGAGNDTFRQEMQTGTFTLRAGSLVNTSTGDDTFSSIELVWLWGNTGSDLFVDALTYPGVTRIQGGSGDDIVAGGAGADYIDGFGGNDTLDGNGGIDTLGYYYTGGMAANLTITGAWITGSGSDSYTDFESIEVFLDATGDTVNAAAAALPVTMWGGGGADALTGGSGGDTLYGEDGNDTLTGNGGTDSLDGGPGTDTCNATVPPDTEVNCEA